MDRTAYIIQTMTQRLAISGSILVPMFVTSEQLHKHPDASRFGWVPPRYTTVGFLGNAPRYVVLIAPDMLVEQTTDLSSTQFVDYVDALIFYFVLFHLHLVDGSDSEQAEGQVMMDLMDKHRPLYETLTTTQLFINDAATNSNLD